MNKADDIDSLTKELTNFLLKAKGEISRLRFYKCCKIKI